MSVLHLRSFLQETNPSEGSAAFSHEIVQDAMRLVHELETKFCYQAPESITELIERIGRKRLHIDEETSVHIFRYFAAAAVYSKSIYDSFTSKFDELKVINNIDMSDLNNLARKIVEELKKYSRHGDEPSRYLSGIKAYSLTSMLASYKYRATESSESLLGRNSTASPKGSNVPFIKVYSDRKSEIFMRRNIELDSSDSKAVFVTDSKMDLKHYPKCVFHNGTRVMGFLEGHNFENIIKDAVYRKKILYNKYVTWIQIHLPSGAQKQTIYEIDFTDCFLQRDPNLFSINPDTLLNFTGCARRKRYFKKEEECYEQDLIVSFFSHLLFENSSGNKWCCINTYNKKNNCSEESKCPKCIEVSEMEIWSHKLISSFTSEDILNNRSSGCMYIGFCFRTLMSGGYTDKTIVNSSTSLLLIALCRGLVKLASNNSKVKSFMSESIKEQFKNDNTSEDEKDQQIIEKRDIPFGIVNPNYYTRHEAFISANSKEITVKAKIPYLVWILAFMHLTLILSYGIPLGIRQRYIAEKLWEEYWSGLITIVTASSGISFLVFFFRGWDLSDMFHRRRTARCMSELEKAQARADVIKIFAQIRNPGEVFSSRNSSAFTSDARGEFQIDYKITVRHLQEAGFIFGVDYYGHPIVSDSLGRIREIEFEPLAEVMTILETTIKQEKETIEAKYECDQTQSILSLGKMYDWNLKYLYKLPIANGNTGDGFVFTQDIV